MRELIVTEFITLDGVIEAPGGEPTHPHTGWTIDFAGPEQLQYKLNEVLDGRGARCSAARPTRASPRRGRRGKASSRTR